MASTRISRLLKILAGAIADADVVFPLAGRLEQFVHFWALVVRHFLRHRCFVRASALSYSTLLALIPLLVVALSVTSSLLKNQDEEKLSKFIEKIVASVAPSASLPTNSSPAGLNVSPPTGTNSRASVTEDSGRRSEVGGQGATVTNAVLGAANATVAATPPPPGEGTRTTPDADATNTATGATAAPVTEPVMSPNIQKEVARWISQLVQKTSSGTLGVTGLIVLICTAIGLLRGIEETFNHIWGVRRCRSWLLQIMLYWTILTLGPLLLVSALGLTGSLHLHSRDWIESSPVLAPVFHHLLPIAISSFLLAWFYKLTPNTKVDFGSALSGGLVAGTVWHGYNQLGFLLTARAVGASLAYGGLALVVLVMGGLYLVWLILLLGAEIAYAHQNRAAYLQDRLAENVNQRGREFVAVRIMTCLGRRFQDGLPPATLPEISVELGVPSRLTQSVLSVLATTRLVTEVAGAEAAFVPARPLDAINAHDILLAMRTGTGQELPWPEQPNLAEIYGEFARIEQAERTAAAGITLQALASRMPARLGGEAAAAALVRTALAAPPAVKPEQAAAPWAEKMAELGPVEISKPTPFPEKIELPEPVAQPEPVIHREPPRRETARPEENTDFPL